MSKEAPFRRFIRRNSLKIMNKSATLTIFNQPKVNKIRLSQSDYQKIYPFLGMESYQLTDQRSRLPLQKKFFELLVWNLHKGKDNNWQQELKNFGKNCDFILLQEVIESNQVETIWDKVMYGIHAGSYEYRDDMSGGMLLSHYLPNQYFVGTGYEPWTRIPKISIAAKYPLIEGKELLLVNLHLVNFELSGNHYSQQLKEAFELVQRHKGPLIVAGDFNSWSESRLKLLESLAKTFTMHDVKFVNDRRKQFFGRPLDHIYVRDLKIVESYVYDTDSSDHNPMHIKFVID